MARAKGGFNILAMLVAFGTIGGFLYWLAVNAVPTEVAVAEEEATAQAVSLALFARSPTIYEGDLVAVDNVEVQSVAGAQLFFVSFPDDASYPVRVAASLGAAGASISPDGHGPGYRHGLCVDRQRTRRVGGRVRPSRMMPPGEAVAASSTFILATEIDLAPAAPPEGEGGWGLGASPSPGYDDGTCL